MSGSLGKEHLSSETRAFYRRALKALGQSAYPFMVGGAYALERYTGVERHTKDLDIFVRPEDAPGVLDRLANAGYRTEMTYPHWLGKAHLGDDFIDIIFASGNGLCRVDDVWFRHAVDDTVLDRAVKVCPPEEMIWSKAYVMERERYDGADIAHLLRACGPTLDWPRLLDRFGTHWPVLLAHVILFRFIYPGEQGKVPDQVMQELARRLRTWPHKPPGADHVCRGTLFSREQYLVDVENWGYRDARLTPGGKMTAGDIQVWTDAIDDSPSGP
jgi:hypothetical protein